MTIKEMREAHAKARTILCSFCGYPRPMLADQQGNAVPLFGCIIVFPCRRCGRHYPTLLSERN